MGLTLLLLVLVISHGGELTRVEKTFVMEGGGDFWVGLEKCYGNDMDGLAIIESPHDNEIILSIEQEDYVWIGLWDDMNNWTWSLNRAEFDNHKHFSLWSPSRPQLIVGEPICVAMDPNGHWTDRLCTEKLPAVCFYESGQAKYILLTAPKTWSIAGTYCRTEYTDLVSVRNLTENGNVSTLLTKPSWIGLYRLGWGKWHDKTSVTFTNFREEDMLLNQTSSVLKNCAVASTNTGLWKKVPCDDRYEYICQIITQSSFENTPEAESTLSTNTFKLHLQADTELNDPRIQEQLLLQLGNLAQKKLGPLKLRWVQTNGQVFHMKTEKKQNQECRDVT